MVVCDSESSYSDDKATLLSEVPGGIFFNTAIIIRFISSFKKIALALRCLLDENFS